MVLRTENLTLTYPDVNELIYAVRDAECSFPEKGLHIIIGPSGSGKTSLLYLLSGIKEPSNGRVFFRNETLPSDVASRTALRRARMGFVFQMHFLINYLSVLENVLVGAHKLDATSTQEARSILQKLGLEGLEHRLPLHLSGGQRQRVAIARALMNKPDVLFVDEPTASLDEQNAKKVRELLEACAKEACVIVVTHDEGLLQHADSAYRMRNGSIEKLKI